jgi:hypothetical protein
MKKIISLIFFLFLIQFGHSQIFYNSSSKNLRYAGGMDSEVMELLTSDEKNMLNECIIQCGVNPDSAIWITKKVYDNLVDPMYYSTKMVYKSTSDRVGGSKNVAGKNILNKPQFMMFIDRYNGEFEVVLQMYY